MAATYSYYQDGAGQWWRFGVNTDGILETTAVSGPPSSSTAGPLRTLTVLDLITNAMLEIGAVAGDELPTASESKFALNKLNRVLDNWTAEPLMIYDTSFQTYTLTPGKNPHTIGPNSADFPITPRPVRILYANLLLTDISPVLRRPLEIRDDGWWASLRQPTLSTAYPSDLHYHPDWPNGQIVLWPVPTAGYGLELVLDTALAQFFNLTDTVSLPPGYEDALTLTLAENLCEPFGRPAGQMLIAKAQEARARIKSANLEVPEMSCDPAITSGYGAFDWRTGEMGKTNR